MSSYYEPETTAATIMCCICGICISSNPLAMCLNCIKAKIDITEGITKQNIVYFCRGCQRYNIPPSYWVKAELESPQLLAILLKRIKGLNKVRLVDAGFIWTEPHSKKIKVKLVIEKAVLTGTILQHSFVIEFIVNSQFCDDCHQLAAKDHWNAIVQLRQKVKHKKTFLYIEQLIMKHKAHTKTTNIKERSEGLDFYFSARSDAQKLVDFLQTISPIKFKTSERLVSADIQSNTANFKYTFSVEIVPVCKEDLICFPRKIAASNGNINQIVLCNKVGASLKFLDPSSLQMTEISSDKYWKQPFMSLCSYYDLVEFIVLDIEIISKKGKFFLADVQCVRANDFGHQKVYFTKTHLGRILRIGDSCMGYDLMCLNLNNEDFEKMDDRYVSSVVLVKKHFPNRRNNKRPRRWKLKTITKDVEFDNSDDEAKAAASYDSFMQDVEEDKEFRSKINIYRDPQVQSTIYELEDEEDDFPEPTIEEMLDELTLNEDE